MAATPLTPQIIIPRRWIPSPLQAKIRDFNPRSELGRVVRDCLRYLPPEMAADLLDKITSAVVLESGLYGVVIRHPENVGRGPGRIRDLLYQLHARREGLLRAGEMEAAAQMLPTILRLSQEAGLLEPCGLLSRRVVTTAGVNFIVDAFQNSTELENFKYHGLGTNSTAEASSDSALGAELTTQYNPDSTRATGTTTEGASANIYRTVATNTVDASAAVTEHGVFSAASAGTLLDRSVFSTVNLTSGDSLQTTYDLTCSAGG